MRLALLVLALLQAGAPNPTPPSATIGNGRIRATVLLPDAKTGYYRGTRFDWSGNVSSLTWNGHEYFGQWFERYDNPSHHDAIMGPVEEFQTGSAALGYAEAPAGGTFVRIGVGVLRKPAEAAFRRFETYEIVDPGKWTTKSGADRVDFTHELSHPAGYAYVYRKTLRLDGDTLVIEHELKNTGTKRIDTDVYNHNFFTLDRRTTGPDVVVRFPFEPRARRPLKLLALKGREIAPLREFAAGESDFTELEGFGADASHYGFEVENRATGAGVRVSGGRPLTKYIFWASVKTICPEGYIDVSADPGKASIWTQTYAFYDAKAR